MCNFRNAHIQIQMWKVASGDLILGETQKTEMIRKSSLLSYKQVLFKITTWQFVDPPPLKNKYIYIYKYLQLRSSPPPRALLQKPLFWWEKTSSNLHFVIGGSQKQRILCSTSYPKRSTWLVYLHVSSFKKNSQNIGTCTFRPMNPIGTIFTYMLIYVHHDCFNLFTYIIMFTYAYVYIYIYVYVWICSIYLY